ncbi:MAG: hypothetical protein F6K32_15040 [Desertifilum sp. SIO1I2]|nr:hypothetical protein [Desertifilum sp. SIO1I2]
MAIKTRNTHSENDLAASHDGLPPEIVVPELQKQYTNFVQSLGQVLTDITALEVSTMVVSHISASKFIPEEAYRDIYEIPENGDTQYFRDRQIPESLYPQYRAIRRKLLAAYQRIPLSLDQPTSNWTETLPNPNNPNDTPRVQSLLSDSRFLRGLRKISEIKTSLDQYDESFPLNHLIYAQTVMQLDGDILHRYHQGLLEQENRELLIKIHQEGVISGEKQWRGVIGFMVDFVQMLLRKQANSASLPPNGR